MRDVLYVYLLIHRKIVVELNCECICQVSVTCEDIRVHGIDERMGRPRSSLSCAGDSLFMQALEDDTH